MAGVREHCYTMTRDIDWNVTARYNRPYIKIFEEERELTVMLMIYTPEGPSAPGHC